jgi:MATE family multidrug resistance protein
MSRRTDRLIDSSTNPGGCRDVLRVAFPLVLSTSSWGLLHFVDRMFLSWYSNDALAAAVPGSITNFCLVSLFMGTATYVNTFIAQYIGANRPTQVGRILWQGIYFSLVSGFLLLIPISLARPLFELVGHDPAVMEMEIQYFRILCYGSGAAVLGNTFGGFFIGRGKTLVVMCINITGVATNVVLDYAWIFGHLGFPRLGIRGAAYATVVSAGLRVLLYMAVVFLPAHSRTYGIVKGWRPDWSLFRRFIRFGLPNGMQFMLEMLGFTLFVLLVGRISSQALAATNVAFNINSLAFTPMLGFAFAVSTLVGQYLGADRPDLAERSVNSAFRMTCIYMGSFCLLYLSLPTIFVRFFGSRTDPEGFEAIRDTVVVLLRFVAAYSLFDMLNIVYAHAIKGAGDTRFVMWVSVGLSWPILIVPTYLVSIVYQGSVYTAWFFMTAYVIVLGITFYLRFRGGKWKSMRVIEGAPRIHEALPELPTVELEFAQPGERADTTRSERSVSPSPEDGDAER